MWVKLKLSSQRKHPRCWLPGSVAPRSSPLPFLFRTLRLNTLNAFHNAPLASVSAATVPRTPFHASSAPPARLPSACLWPFSPCASVPLPLYLSLSSSPSTFTGLGRAASRKAREGGCCSREDDGGGDRAWGRHANGAAACGGACCVPLLAARG